MILNKKINESFIDLDMLETHIKYATNLLKLSKKDSYDELQKFINSLIVFYNTQYVFIRDMDMNRRTQFNTVMNFFKRKIKNNQINYPYVLKVPNSLYNRIPIKDKITNPYTINGWNVKAYAKTNFTTSTSPYFGGLIKSITANTTNTLLTIKDMKLYDEVICNDKNELLKNIEKLRYPNNDVQYIMNYISSVLSTLNNILTFDISSIDPDIKKALSSAFIQINQMNGLFKNTINILVSIYDVKLSTIYVNVSNVGAKTMIKESVYNHAMLYEACNYLENGLSVESIENTNKQIMSNNKSNIDALLLYITNIYNNTMEYLTVEKISKSIDIIDYRFNKKILDLVLEPMFDDSKSEYFYKSYMKRICSYDFENGLFISNTDTDAGKLLIENMDKIRDIISKEYHIIKSTLDNLKTLSNDELLSGIEYKESKLFDRKYNQLGIIIKNEIDELRDELLECEYIRDLCDNNIKASLITSNTEINELHYGYLLYKITNECPEVAELFKRFYTTKCDSKRFMNLNYKLPENTQVKYAYEIPDYLVAQILNFQTKCDYLISI